MAKVLADGFSIAPGNYSGTKAEADNACRLRRSEERRTAREPRGKRREFRQSLASMGPDGDVLEEATGKITKNRDSSIDLMPEREYGVSPADPTPFRAALATFLAFLAAGLVPLMPFMLGLADAFRLSVAMTGPAFFAIGALKSRWSLSSWWRSGAETLAIGGTAAGIAHFVGTLRNAG